MTPSTVPPAVALLTADEFVAQFGHLHAELEEGIVKELPMPGLKHGEICMLIGWLLMNHVRANNLGRVMSNDSAVKTKNAPDSVRGADVCYYSYERLPKHIPTPDSYAEVPPDLVVEVRSPSDRMTESLAKILEYLKVGVRVVIFVDPKTASVTVYRDDDEFDHTFHNGDELTVPDVLPGFSMVVKQLFE